VIWTESSGTWTTQKTPESAVPGLKSCTWFPELGSKKSSHISTNVPDPLADFEAPTPPTDPSTPTNFP
jgi:hypothetical protein